MHERVFKDHQNCTSPKNECILKSWKNSRVYVFPNCTRNHTITMDCKIILLSMLLLIHNIHEKKLCMQSLSHSYIKTPKCFFVFFSAGNCCILLAILFYWHIAQLIVKMLFKFLQIFVDWNPF
jgi:hypothetical protein